MPVFLELKVLAGRSTTVISSTFTTNGYSAHFTDQKTETEQVTSCTQAKWAWLQRPRLQPRLSHIPKCGDLRREREHRYTTGPPRHAGSARQVSCLSVPRQTAPGACGLKRQRQGVQSRGTRGSATHIVRWPWRSHPASASPTSPLPLEMECQLLPSKGASCCLEVA